MPSNLLSDRKIQADLRAFSKQSRKVQKLTDGDGLSLLVRSGCRPTWFFEYEKPRTPDGKRRRAQLTLGPYPDLTLAHAREAALEQRTKLLDGHDPKARGADVEGITFRGIAKLWQEARASSLKLSDSHLRTVQQRLDCYLFSQLGDRPLRTITPDDIRTVLTPILSLEHAETAKRTLGIAKQIFRFAKVHGHIATIPTEGFEELIAHYRKPVKPTPSITDPVNFARLLKDIDGYEGRSVVTRLALQLIPLVALRPGKEFRQAKWSEIDFARAVWSVPLSRMKIKSGGKDHEIPLSDQAIATLQRLKMVGNGSEWICPAESASSRPISENTLNAALKRLGYRGVQTPHGFRASFQTIAKEHRVAFDFIDHEAVGAQLAHSSGKEAKMHYDRTKYFEQRRALMQRWADYLDDLRGAKLCDLVQQVVVW